MKLLIKLLNPWIVVGFVLLLIMGSVAHLYLASCQTTKWHYICQKYYCPEWYEPKLDPSDIKSVDEWRGWYRNGQLKVLLSPEVSGNFIDQVWYENGQLKHINERKAGGQIAILKRWDAFGMLVQEMNYNNITGQNKYFDIYDTCKKEHVRLKAIRSHRFGQKNDWKGSNAYRYIESKKEYFNGQLKNEFKIKTGVISFSYQFINSKKKAFRNLDLEKIFDLLNFYFQVEKDDLLIADTIDEMTVHKSKVLDYKNFVFHEYIGVV